MKADCKEGSYALRCKVRKSYGSFLHRNEFDGELFDDVVEKRRKRTYKDKDGNQKPVKPKLTRSYMSPEIKYPNSPIQQNARYRRYVPYVLVGEEWLPVCRYGFNKKTNKQHFKRRVVKGKPIAAARKVAHMLTQEKYTRQNRYTGEKTTYEEELYLGSGSNGHDLYSQVRQNMIDNGEERLLLVEITQGIHPQRYNKSGKRRVVHATIKNPLANYYTYQYFIYRERKDVTQWKIHDKLGNEHVVESKYKYVAVRNPMEGKTKKHFKYLPQALVQLNYEGNKAKRQRIAKENLTGKVKQYANAYHGR